MNGSDLASAMMQFRDALDNQTRELFNKASNIINDIMEKCYDELSKDDMSVLIAMTLICMTIGFNEDEEDEENADQD